MTAAEAERLSLIRYQVRSIAETLRQPAPVNTLAINVMQDAVESTLGAVGEHIRADVASRSDFAKLLTRSRRSWEARRKLSAFGQQRSH